MEHDRLIHLRRATAKQTEGLADAALATFFIEKNWEGIKSLGYSKIEIKELKRKRRKKIKEKDITPSPEANIGAILY